MTTEVLRNMLYAGSRTLLGLGFVVMDEVHYLADRSRGAVWEEVIIHLPESVALVSLSATVSNAEEFGEWLQTVRGDTATIVEERRPVPLYQHVMVGKRHPRPVRVLRHRRGGRVREGGRAGQRRAGPAGPRRLGQLPDEATAGRPRTSGVAAARAVTGARSATAGGCGSRAASTWSTGSTATACCPPSCSSSAGSAARRRSSSACRRTCGSPTPAERDEVHERVETACRHLPDDDLHVLGYHDFLDALTRGIGRPPRGDAAGLQGGRGGAVHPRAW